MSDDEELEPLPADLRSLIDAARTSSDAPAPGKDRVRARLASSLAVPPGGGGGGAPAASGVGKLVAAFVTGGVVGATALYAVLPPREVVRIVEVDRVVGPPLTVSVPHVERPPSLPASLPLPEPSAPAVRPSAAAQASNLDAERILLDPARTALGRKEGQRALDAVNAHEARFPNGALSEEREAIAVQALVQLGRKDEAGVRGARFVKRYPGSVLKPVVDAALEAR